MNHLKRNEGKRGLIYFYLILINLYYSLIAIVTKLTSGCVWFSFRFFCGIGIIVILLGCYAVLWQQILKRIELTTAFMFKGTSLIFILIISNLVFKETISIYNIVGSVLIIVGIALFAKG